MIHRKISIYGLFKIINIIILLLMIYTYSSIGSNSYINVWSIIIGSIFVVISHFVLSDASRNKNHLLAILAYIVVVHYELRIVTLNFTEYSEVYNLFTEICTNDINIILIYCALAYVVCWIGFHYSIKRDKVSTLVEPTYKKKASRNVLVILYLSFFLDLMSGLNVPIISHIVRLASTFFFNIIFIMMYGLAFFIHRWNYAKKNEKRFFVAILLLYVVIHTIGGSRSALYTIFIFIFICLLAFDVVKIRTKWVLLGGTLVPLLVLMFIYATIIRSSGKKITTLSDVAEVTRMVKENVGENEVILLLGPVCNRIAFFDYTSQMVKDREHLSQYVHPINYMKSIVDNLFTPGFNIFDMPRMSYVVGKCYTIGGTPSLQKYKLTEEGNYLSSCMTWFGESYLIFGGYFALPVILIVGVIIRKMYIKRIHHNDIANVWQRIIILYVTYDLLYSYGLDWVFIGVVGLIINYYIFMSVTIDKKREVI